VERSKEQLTARLVGLMQLISNQVRPVPPEEWSELELTMPQWRTLVLLNRGPRRMSEVAAHLGSSLSSATSMIDRLLNKQLVARMQDPADRRVVSCRLTAQGQAQVDWFWHMGRKKIEQVRDILNREELEAVVHAMEVLLTAMDRQAPNASGERQASSL
jgi:DNA-binding MarR family transcriptional regulator